MNEHRPTLSVQEANNVAQGYLKLIDNRYALCLTQQEAAELGISESVYKKMLYEVSSTNQKIDEILKLSPSDVVKLPDPAIYISGNRYITDGSHPGMSRAAGSIPDQNPYRFPIKVPVGALTIVFNIYSNSLLGWGDIRLFDTSGRVFIDSDWFIQIGPSTSCSVNVPGPGIYIAVITVSSSGGGYYAYSFTTK